MSVIGPRPQTLECFNYFPEIEKDKIISVRPGLSGAGSIFFRNEDKMTKESSDPSRFYKTVIMPYKSKIEISYVENRNIINYFYLILLTVIAVLNPKSSLLKKFYLNLPEIPESLRKYI